MTAAEKKAALIAEGRVAAKIVSRVARDIPLPAGEALLRRASITIQCLADALEASDPTLTPEDAQRGDEL